MWFGGAAVGTTWSTPGNMDSQEGLTGRTHEGVTLTERTHEGHATRTHDGLTERTHEGLTLTERFTKDEMDSRKGLTKNGELNSRNARSKGKRRLAPQGARHARRTRMDSRKEGGLTNIFEVEHHAIRRTHRFCPRTHEGVSQDRPS